jgi:Putative Flp pilus-assembly TadE/G-like
MNVRSTDSMKAQQHRHEGERGQALAIMALALIALLAMTALIIDGGNAWAQQRVTQNGSDSAAEAGTVILMEGLSGASQPSSSISGTCPTATTDTWDLAVCQAVYGAAAQNGIDLTSAYYTNYDGSQNLAKVGSGSVPTGAQGIHAIGTKQFSTYVARVIGINDMTATTEATAVTGIIVNFCPQGQVCGVLPVTFPISVTTCDNTGSMQIGTDPWPITSDYRITNPPNTLSIVPLCKTGPGSVGWLDFSSIATSCSGTQLYQQILNPCVVDLDLSKGGVWIQTTSGNPNDTKVQNAVDSYDGQTVLIPLFDGTCKTQPSGPTLAACTTGAGVGNNTWYHIPQFQGFHLYQAYIQGNNFPACNAAPGRPLAGGNGGNGCLKGWFTNPAENGKIHIGPVQPGTSQPLGVNLIK